MRLDRFLVGRFPEASRASIRRWILDGHVRVDGLPPAKAGQPLQPGQRIDVAPPAPPATGLVPEPVPFELVHEDDDLLVVVKPAGVTVHPGHGQATGTLVHGLLHRGWTLSPIGAPDRPGVVHRLDRDTSGLLVIARTERAHRGLAEAFARREVTKRYLALVWGHPDPAEGTIERAIGRSRANPTKMSVRGTRGRTREARTHYRTEERLTGFSRLSVEIETGRTHQIRVHLESIHHPIVGDERYGGRAWRGIQDPLKRKAVRTFERLALHACELAFRHPVTGGTLRFRAPLPDEMERLLEALRRD